MSKFKPFLFGMIVGAGVAVCALQFHIVQSHEGFRVVPRTPQPSLGLAYVDVRGWDVEQWADRPELVRALVANGSTDLVAESVSQEVVDAATTEDGTLDKLRDFLNKPAAAPFTDDVEESDTGLRIPDEEEVDSTFDELFTLPFPKDAKKDAETPTAARAPSNANPRFASRDRSSVRDVESSESGFDSIRKPDNSFAPSTGRTMTSPDRTESEDDSADLLESMLFGDEAESSGFTEDSGSVSDAVDDIGTSFRNRAENTLRRAHEGIRNKTSEAVDARFDDVSRFIRGETTAEDEDTDSAQNRYTRSGAAESNSDSDASADRYNRYGSSDGDSDPTEDEYDSGYGSRYTSDPPADSSDRYSSGSSYNRSRSESSGGAATEDSPYGSSYGIDSPLDRSTTSARDDNSSSSTGNRPSGSGSGYDSTYGSYGSNRFDNDNSADSYGTSGTNRFGSDDSDNHSGSRYGTERATTGSRNESADGDSQSPSRNSWSTHRSPYDSSGNSNRYSSGSEGSGSDGRTNDRSSGRRSGSRSTGSSGTRDTTRPAQDDSGTSMFDDAESFDNEEEEENLPAPLRALNRGFDPFFE